jgi:hypothetical protein
VPQLPTAPRVLLKAQFTPAYQPQTGEPQAAAESRPVAFRTADSEPAITPTGARLITHEEAQEKAAPANNAITRLGQLQVEVARQTRLGTLSTFFPPRGSTFSNMRFNKRMGKEIQFTGPLKEREKSCGAATRIESDGCCRYRDAADHASAPASGTL